MLTKYLAVICCILILLFVANFTLGPGVGNQVSQIAKGVYFSHAGKYQNQILLERGGDKKIAISANVEDFSVEEGYVYVARRPVKHEYTDSHKKGITTSSCEYWIIRVVDGFVFGPFNQDEFEGDSDGCQIKRRSKTKKGRSHQ